MSWVVRFLPEVDNDLRALSNNQRVAVFKAIDKVKMNPLPQSEGGYGKPLGNKGGINLTGFLKIKLRRDGIRIVYTLVRQEDQMIIVVVGMRADDDAYTIAARRRIKYFCDATQIKSGS